MCVFYGSFVIISLYVSVFLTEFFQRKKRLDITFHVDFQGMNKNGTKVNFYFPLNFYFLRMFLISSKIYLKG